jgi:hypothetical protein
MTRVALLTTKHDDLIVCASTACLRARLRTEPGPAGTPSGSACAITCDALFSLARGGAESQIARCAIARAGMIDAYAQLFAQRAERAQA